jgi:hypothetical protein
MQSRIKSPSYRNLHNTFDAQCYELTLCRRWAPGAHRRYLRIVGHAVTAGWSREEADRPAAKKPRRSRLPVQPAADHAPAQRVQRRGRRLQRCDSVFQYLPPPARITLRVFMYR